MINGSNLDGYVQVSSAAGGCGQYALQNVEKAGGKVVAMVGSEAKAQFLLTKFPHLQKEQVGPMCRYICLH